MNEEMNTNQDSENIEEENQLSHSDKLVGVFSEPTVTFASMAKFPVKAMDWLLPLLIVAVISAVGMGIIFSKPAIKQKFLDKATEQMETRFQDSIDNGEMTQEQADNIIEMSSGFIVISAVAGRAIGSIVMFFIMSLILFLVAKFALKGDGTFSGTLAACGLPQYIITIEIILTVILSIFLGRFIEGVSIGALMDSDKTTLVGYILSMLDVFMIWYLVVISIALSKMFKSATTGKYYAMNFVIWLIVSAIIFSVQ